MNNQSLQEAVESFIEDINNCEDRHAIEILLATKDLRIYGMHTRYNSTADIDKADQIIQTAVENRLQEFN